MSGVTSCDVMPCHAMSCANRRKQEEGTHPGMGWDGMSVQGGTEKTKRSAASYHHIKPIPYRATRQFGISTRSYLAQYILVWPLSVEGTVHHRLMDPLQDVSNTPSGDRCGELGVFRRLLSTQKAGHYGRKRWLYIPSQRVYISASRWVSSVLYYIKLYSHGATRMPGCLHPAATIRSTT